MPRYAIVAETLQWKKSYTVFLGFISSLPYQYFTSVHIMKEYKNVYPQLFPYVCYMLDHV